MNTITIYRFTCTQGVYPEEQGARWSLKPWGVNTDRIQGFDDGGAEYELPPGFEVAESQGASLEIYNAHGQYCALFDKDGAPCICDPGLGAEQIRLRKVE